MNVYHLKYTKLKKVKKIKYMRLHSLFIRQVLENNKHDSMTVGGRNECDLISNFLLDPDFSPLCQFSAF